MQKVIISELKPTNGRKSFYGNAELMYIPEGGATYLRSYNTIVAGYINGKVYRFWGGRSTTTDRHLAAFLATVGANISVSEFNHLDVDTDTERAE